MAEELLAQIQKIVDEHEITVDDSYSINYCPGFLGIIIQRGLTTQHPGTEIYRYFSEDGNLDNAATFVPGELDKDVRNKLIYDISFYPGLDSDWTLSKYFGLHPTTIRAIINRMAGVE